MNIASYTMRQGFVVALLSSSTFFVQADDLINEEVVDTLPDVPQGSDLESGLFVASLNCGPSFVSCVDAGPCFDHSMGCAEDGSIVFQECSSALPFCKPCFPNSRCASDAPSDSSQQNETIPDTPQESNDDSALFVESESCGPEFATCAEAANCFDHSLGCAEDGSMVFPQCSSALPFCKPCFPNSRCGSDEENLSGVFVESDSCGPEFASCAEAAPCFDHFMGCAEDGSIVFPECSPALPFCKPCFPNSRCASSESSVSTPQDDEDEEDASPQEENNSASAFFVESESCGPTFASCAEAAPCFDHSMGCAEDGTMIYPDCSSALPFCKPCFPNSRCGSSADASISAPQKEEEVEEDDDVSGSFVESKSCGPTFASCAEAAPCFDHSMGCAEDGTMIYPDCSSALPFCKPCFPNSRCGSGGTSEDVLADKDEINEDLAEEESPNGNNSAEEESLDTDTSAMEMMSGAHRSGVATVILSLVAAGISW